MELMQASRSRCRVTFDKMQQKSKSPWLRLHEADPNRVRGGVMLCYKVCQERGQRQNIALFYQMRAHWQSHRLIVVKARLVISISEGILD